MITVTTKDTETGEENTDECEDYVVVTTAPYYVSHVQRYPTKGTTILTIKRQDGDDEPA